MYNNLKPIPRHLLAKFLSDPETIKAFEKIVENAGTLIPEDVNEINAAAESAGARAAAVEGMLDALRQTLHLIALAPFAQPSVQDALTVAHQQALPDLDVVPPPMEHEPLPYAYGDMYSNTETVVAVAAANTAYEITSNLSGSHAHLMTFGGGHYLRADRGGKFEINWSVSISTSSAGDALEGGIMIDGTAQTEGLAHGTVGNANSEIEISGTAILTVAALQQISLYVMNHSAARGITFKHVSFTAKLLDRRVP